jgi:2-C-methyl-D-erythritol 4-phosphate cytidylyltransferase
MATEAYSAIVMAGGSHSRFGEANPLREKLGGISMLAHSLDIFDSAEECSEIIISVSADVRAWIEGEMLSFSSPKLKLCDSAPSRMDSLAAALRIAANETIVVHDGNRPNFSGELLESVLDALRPGQASAAAVLANSPAGYIAPLDKSADAAGSADSGEKDFFGNVVKKRPDRRFAVLAKHIDVNNLVSLQSPQAATKTLLTEALFSQAAELAGYDDESALLSSAGVTVALVEGRQGNLAVATQAELKLLIKLMGLPTKRTSKDKYGGLGW